MFGNDRLVPTVQVNAEDTTVAAPQLLDECAAADVIRVGRGENQRLQMIVERLQRRPFNGVEAQAYLRTPNL